MKCPNCGYDHTISPIYHALIKTPDGAWNPIFSSIDKQLVMRLAQNFARQNKRIVKIRQHEESNHA